MKWWATVVLYLRIIWWSNSFMFNPLKLSAAPGGNGYHFYMTQPYIQYQFPSIYFPYLLVPECRITGVYCSPFQWSLGKGWVTPWTSRQLVAEPHRNQKSFTHSISATDNLEFSVDITCMFLDCINDNIDFAWWEKHGKHNAYWKIPAYMLRFLLVSINQKWNFKCCRSQNTVWLWHKEHLK